mmetsp:Transcript_26282/g.35443  ORF Transcript_26282/g.35443 Transcript_26282/m.35443 type:complete len:91 (-) Transcript_26282:254-526(-)
MLARDHSAGDPRDPVEAGGADQQSGEVAGTPRPEDAVLQRGTRLEAAIGSWLRLPCSPVAGPGQHRGVVLGLQYQRQLREALPTAEVLGS